MRSFLEFVDEKKKSMEPLATKITLGDGNDFEPFVISDDPNSQFYGKNSGLAPIVKAFKKGGNWGWSKDDSKGEDKPIKIGSKKLYLVGGALRDHLAGKKPREIELVTNASSDEIFQLLKQNNFKFSGDTDGPGDMTFWVSDKSNQGRPFRFGVRVRNDKYELGVFSKTHKNFDPESGSQMDDASGRDFTINAMSLLLSNDDGPNKDLQDYYGGLHHLKSGKIVPVGDFTSKLQEDPIRILRFARMLARYGDPSSVLDSEKDSIRNIASSLVQADRQKVIDEFMRIFTYSDANIRSFLQIYDDLGILDYLFPNLVLDKDLPPKLQETGDKLMPLAWLVRHHMPEEIESGFQGFDPNLVRKILFLVKSLGMNENIDADYLDNIRSSFLTSGVSPKGLQSWATKIGQKKRQVVDAFLEYIRIPRVKYYISEANNEVHEDFRDLVDPFSGQIDYVRAAERKNQIEHKNFLSVLKKHMPDKTI